ncbi:MAG: hypothetical protein MJ109_06995 [Kiritimatiellae bacterium]|nr:hypothetical protein [Kiritimatiellia bacterium]
MESKTTIQVMVDDKLAASIQNMAIKNYRETTYSGGKRRVFVTFEEVKAVATAGE